MKQRDDFGLGRCPYHENVEIKKAVVTSETGGESVPKEHSYKCPKKFLVSFFRKKSQNCTFLVLKYLAIILFVFKKKKKTPHRKSMTGLFCSAIF